MGRCAAALWTELKQKAFFKLTISGTDARLVGQLAKIFNSLYFLPPWLETSMKSLSLAAVAIAVAMTAPVMAGDPVAGKQKAVGCVACHGNETFSGIFFTLQLAGRDADKLLIKSNKYKSGKILHPVMNMATALYSEKDLEDISAYYQSLGKPALSLPFIQIKGDEEEVPAGAASGMGTVK
jgi:cytochrome c553